jgi:hypothetical protein
MANGNFEMVEMRFGCHHMNDRNRRYLVVPMGRDEGRLSTDSVEKGARNRGGKLVLSS